MKWLQQFFSRCRTWLAGLPPRKRVALISIVALVAVAIGFGIASGD